MGTRYCLDLFMTNHPLFPRVRKVPVIGHNGAVPGFLTELAFFPGSDIGFVIMINTMSFTGLAEMFSQTMNVVLGMQTEGSTDSASGSTKSGEFTFDYFPTTSLTTTTTPIEHLTEHEHQQGSYQPPPSLHALAGIYWNDGYGTLTICAPETISPYCQRTRADFAAVDDVDNAPQRPKQQLVAAWGRFISSHIRFIPRVDVGEDELAKNASIVPFTMQLLDIFPKGYGADKTPFALDDKVGPFEINIDADFVLAAAPSPSDLNSSLDIGSDGADGERQLEVIGLGVRGLDFANDRLPAREGWDVYWHKIRPDW